MFFDCRKKTYMGKLGYFSAEELDESRRLVEVGIMVSTEHPSQELQERMRRILLQRDMEKEEAEAAVLAEAYRRR